MNTDNTDVPAAAPNALQDFINCDDWGNGGQFIYDPATKTRTRLDAVPVPAGVPTASLEATSAATPASLPGAEAAPGSDAAPAAVTSAAGKKGVPRA